MKKTLIYVAATMAAGCLAACSENDITDGDGQDEQFSPQTYALSGKVEKGPFVSGSTVSVQPMNGHLELTGQMYNTTILDDAGNFDLGSKLFDAPYAELTGNGYFFNEVSGNLSAGTLNLRALVSLKDQSTVNVNLLTHLKYKRIQKLIKDGASFGEANKKAQQELFDQFGLGKYAETDAASVSIIEGTDESAALIAMSSLILADRTEAGLTEYLAKLGREFGDNGCFSDETKGQLKKDLKYLGSRLDRIEENIRNRYKELGLDVAVRDLAYFFDWDGDGLAGNESLKDGEKVALSETHLSVPNKGGVYKVNVSSPIPVLIERPGSEGGDVISPIYPDYSYNGLYEAMHSAAISFTKALKDNVLTIEVAPLDNYKWQKDSVMLYDYLGNEVGKVVIEQECREMNELPKLGNEGSIMVNGISERFLKTMQLYSIIEQKYNYNKEGNLVSNIDPHSDDVKRLYSEFYGLNNMQCTLKDADASLLNVYQPICNVWMGLQYYYMITAWGDVPYITTRPTDFGRDVYRERASVILDSISHQMEAALPVLADKKCSPLNRDANDRFFVSKDVARILMANVRMYQQQYDQAALLLKQVMDGGHYRLTDSFFTPAHSVDESERSDGRSEVIFGFDAALSSSRYNITLAEPGLVPLQSYTDVMLSYAECLYHQGAKEEAARYVKQVVSAKRMELDVQPANVLGCITAVRKQALMYGCSNFAYMKRNGLAVDEYGIEPYRQLLPIPFSEIVTSQKMTQNPGY